MSSPPPSTLVPPKNQRQLHRHARRAPPRADPRRVSCTRSFDNHQSTNQRTPITISPCGRLKRESRVNLASAVFSFSSLPAGVQTTSCSAFATVASGSSHCCLPVTSYLPSTLQPVMVIATKSLPSTGSNISPGSPLKTVSSSLKVNSIGSLTLHVAAPTTLHSVNLTLPVVSPLDSRVSLETSFSHLIATRPTPSSVDGPLVFSAGSISLSSSLVSNPPPTSFFVHSAFSHWLSGTFIAKPL